MRIADRVVLDGAQPKALRGVVGRLLEPAIVEHQRFGLAVFQEQFAVVGALKPARHFMAHLVTVEIGAVEQGGCGGIGHADSDCSAGVLPSPRMRAPMNHRIQAMFKRTFGKVFLQHCNLRRWPGTVRLAGATLG